MEGEGGRVCHATDRPRSGDPLLYAGPGRLPHRGRTVYWPVARHASRKTPRGPPWLNSGTGRRRSAEEHATYPSSSTPYPNRQRESEEESVNLAGYQRGPSGLVVELEVNSRSCGVPLLGGSLGGSQESQAASVRRNTLSIHSIR